MTFATVISTVLTVALRADASGIVGDYESAVEGFDFGEPPNEWKGDDGDPSNGSELILSPQYHPFGVGSGSKGTTPEPTSLMLAAIATLAGWVSTWRRRKYD
jgi:hypothetical protein